MNVQEHYHDDIVRQHEHNVYHGLATWFPTPINETYINSNENNIYSGETRITPNSFYMGNLLITTTLYVLLIWEIHHIFW